MAKEDTALGELQEEEGQGEELQDRYPDADIVVGKKATSKETPAPEKKEEEEKETPEKKTASEEKAAEPSDEDDVELLKKDLEKAQRRIKDQESFIGKQSAEVGRLKRLETKVLEATTPEAKKEAKDELALAQERIKDRFLKQGYTEAEATAAIEPYVELVEAADQRRTRRQLQAEFDAQLKEIPHLVKNSGKINPELFEEYSDDIYNRLEKLDPVYRSRNLKEAVLDSYKYVIRDKAESKRQAQKEKLERERVGLITSQAATSPSGQRGKKEPEYSADSILNAGTGKIFEE